MHIEERKTKEGIKYFLGHSFREGGKVHKIRKLLGKDLDKKTLEERKQKAEKLILEEIGQYQLIKDPLKEELSKEDIEFINELQDKMELKITHLSGKNWEKFSEMFTYNTNAIEGSELTQKEVKEILEENKWPNKSREDVAEAYGVREAIDYIKETKEEISLNLIKEIHKIVFKNSKSFAGELRKTGQEVVVRDGIGNIVHMGAPQSRVISLLNELIKWYEKHRLKYPGLLLAAVVHNQFETIHPFADGNGRVGRILMNNILLKKGLPPVNIDLKNRKRYYQVLQSYQKKHNIGSTLDFLIKEYKLTKKELMK